MKKEKKKNKILNLSEAGVQLGRKDGTTRGGGNRKRTQVHKQYHFNLWHFTGHSFLFFHLANLPNDLGDHRALSLGLWL